MYHKSFTSYFLLPLTGSEALITLSQQSDYFRHTWVKSEGTALKNSRKNSVKNENSDRVRSIRCFLGRIYSAAKQLLR